MNEVKHCLIWQYSDYKRLYVVDNVVKKRAGNSFYPARLWQIFKLSFTLNIRVSHMGHPSLYNVCHSH